MIVDIIGGDVLFSPDDDEEDVSKERALVVFKVDENDPGVYQVQMKRSRLF